MGPHSPPDPNAVTAAADNRRRLSQQVRQLGWLYRIRPQTIAAPLYRLLRPDGGRAIVDVGGTRLFVDPFTTHGLEIVAGNGYEQELTDLIQARLPRGGVFVDVGANEGMFAATAARITGAEGLVVAIEPQQRLRDLLEINLALNASGPFQIITSAVTEKDGESLTLNLGPSSHSGGSSLVRAYRWGGQRQLVTGRSVDGILSELAGRAVDLMKVDVEGYEPEVIRSASRSLQGKKIEVLAVDFHASILSQRGKDPRTIDAEIIAHGYRREVGDGISGYAVYAL